jgi:histidinol dehydrogenase
VTGSSTSSSDLDSIRRLLHGAEIGRVEQLIEESRQNALSRVSDVEQRGDRALTDLEQRFERRFEELSQRVTSRLDELARLQQGHADKVTQLLDQVMAELSRRNDALTAETRAGLEELRTRAADLERRKLNAADFGSSLATLGQRLASSGDETSRG